MPVAPQSGDKVLWKYGNDLLLAVEVKEVTPPSLWRRQPIYHVNFLEREGSYDCPHNSLFIPRDHNDALDPQGLLVANMDRLRLPAALDAQAMLDAPRHHCNEIVGHNIGHRWSLPSYDQVYLGHSLARLGHRL